MPDAALDRPQAAHRRHAVAWTRDRHRPLAGRKAGQLRPLVQYWGTNYDWRKVEAKLNALPQFVTKIDGLDIHFIHVRSRHPNALPLIITHGGPAPSSS